MLFMCMQHNQMFKPRVNTAPSDPIRYGTSFCLPALKYGDKETLASGYVDVTNFYYKTVLLQTLRIGSAFLDLCGGRLENEKTTIMSVGGNLGNEFELHFTHDETLLEVKWLKSPEVMELLKETDDWPGESKIISNSADIVIFLYDVICAIFSYNIMRNSVGEISNSVQDLNSNQESVSVSIQDTTTLEECSSDDDDGLLELCDECVA